jgi:hypothetical protein
MHVDTGIITVIQMEVDGTRTAQIDCPSKMIPGPGKYLLAHNLAEPEAVLGWPLFLVGVQPTLDKNTRQFLGPIPKSWGPNTQLQLRGPLGHGFNLPRATRRIALVNFGGQITRLLPLIQPALHAEADITIFTPSILPPLPPAVEIHPLDALPASLSWADFLIIDLPFEFLPRLRSFLGLEPFAGLPCAAQALVHTPMPCAGIGDCGACAVPARKKGYKLACKDGPVFNLNEIEW